MMKSDKIGIVNPIANVEMSIHEMQCLVDLCNWQHKEIKKLQKEVMFMEELSDRVFTLLKESGLIKIYNEYREE